MKVQISITFVPLPNPGIVFFKNGGLFPINFRYDYLKDAS